MHCIKRIALASILAVVASSCISVEVAVGPHEGRPAFDLQLSDDGRYLFFRSDVPGITDDTLPPLATAVYICDLESGTTELLNRRADGSVFPAQGGRAGMSADGSVAAFPEFHADGSFTYYLWSRSAGTATPFMLEGANAPINGFSSDGRLIGTSVERVGEAERAFFDTVTGEVTVHETRRFARFPERAPADSIAADGSYVFVGNFLQPRTQIGYHDVVDDEFIVITELEPATSGPFSGSNGAAGPLPRISADGSVVVYSSTASNFIPEDTDDDEDIYLYDTATGETELVSVDSQGNRQPGDSFLPKVSADGRYVVFVSLAALTPGGGGIRHLYVRDRERGVTRLLSTDQEGVADPYGVTSSRFSTTALSGDGRYAAYSSRIPAPMSITRVVPVDRVRATAVIPDVVDEETTRVRVFGTGYQPDTRFSVTGEGIDVVDAVYLDGGRVDLVLRVAPDAPAGLRDVIAVQLGPPGRLLAGSLDTCVDCLAVTTPSP